MKTEVVARAHQEYFANIGVITIRNVYMKLLNLTKI